MSYSNDPFYERDYFTSQLDKEDKNRKELTNNYQEEQRQHYHDYMQKKIENKKYYHDPSDISDKIGINSQNQNQISLNEKIRKQQVILDNYGDICTNITNDNMFARMGYQPKNIKRQEDNNQNINYHISNNIPIKKLNQNIEIPNNININQYYNPPINLNNPYFDESQKKAKNNKSNINDNMTYKDYLKNQEIKEDQEEYQNYVQNKKKMEAAEFYKQKALENNTYLASLKVPNEIGQNKVNYHMKNMPYNNIQQIPINPNIEHQYKNQIEKANLNNNQIERNIDIYQKYQNSNEPIKISSDPLVEMRDEYLANKRKNIGTYSNLTHTMDCNPYANYYNQINNVNRKEEINNFNDLKVEKQMQYKKSLDEQINNRPPSSYNRKKNNYDIPPDPCKNINFIIINYLFLDSGHNYGYSKSSLRNNPLSQ